MFMLRHLAAAALAVAVASPAMALEAYKSVMVDATPAWAAVGDFCGISTWHPAVEKCELGKKDEKSEIEELRRKIETAGMPKDAHEKAMQELKRLEMMPPMSAESTVSRNYLDWLIAVPWKK